jgi:DNA (cytosine-5)-methyltransferase 1
MDGCAASPCKRAAIAFDTTQITSRENHSNPKAGDPCHPLAAGAHARAIAFDCKASGRNGFDVGEIASTQRAMGRADSHTNGGGHQAVMSGMQVRRLTPRECERLQGAPDDYTAIPQRGKPAADGPRYKALGNSWAVPCARWIGQRIEQVETVTAIREAA